MSERARKTSTNSIYYGDDGIMHSCVADGTEETLQTAQENVRAIAELAAGRRVPLYVDLRPVKSQSREARVFYAGPETARVLSAVALHIGSPWSRVLGNFFMGLNKPQIPTRLFDTKEEALAWLKDFVQ